jgi:hypothetical protein
MVVAQIIEALVMLAQHQRLQCKKFQQHFENPSLLETKSRIGQRQIQNLARQKRETLQILPFPHKPELSDSRTVILPLAQVLNQPIGMVDPSRVMVHHPGSELAPQAHQENSDLKFLKAKKNTLLQLAEDLNRMYSS